MKSLVIKIDKLLSIVFFLAILSSLYLFENQIVSILGALCAVTALMLCCLMLITNYHKMSGDFTTRVFIIMLMYFFAQIISNGRMNALYSIAQILGFMILVIVLKNAKISPSKMSKWRQHVRIVYYSIMLIYFGAFLTNKLIQLNELISPTILKILFPLSWFCIKRNAKTTPIEILIFVVFHFLIEERTAALCMIIVLLFQFLLRRISSRTSNVLFWCVMIGAICMPFFYMWLYEQPIGEMLNLFVRSYTGEYFFSGRNRIWGIIIDGVSKKWMFGLGFGNTFLTDSGIEISTHNLYLYLYLNGGMFLLTLFALFMYGIWKEIKHYAYGDDLVIVGKAYILSLFVFLDMELFLLANNIVISLVWWLTIAFIEAASKNSKLCYAEING